MNKCGTNVNNDWLGARKIPKSWKRSSIFFTDSPHKAGVIDPEWVNITLSSQNTCFQLQYTSCHTIFSGDVLRLVVSSAPFLVADNFLSALFVQPLASKITTN